MTRQQAAVLHADVAGYTRLMEAFEQETHARLMSIQQLVLTPALSRYGGSVVKRTGDGFLATFPTAGEAVTCAIQIQAEVARFELSQQTDHAVRFRMGISIGEIFIEAEDVYGNTVNVAARLQELAEPGTLMISASTREAAGAAITIPAVDLGFLVLKNMDQPVLAFRIGDSTTVVPSGRSVGRLIPRPSVAVLPFRSLDQSKETAYFGEAIVEDITAAMASLRELQVIFRSSAVVVNDTVSDANQAAGLLGVRYILSGTVQQSPTRVRATAELVDTNSSVVEWAQRFDFPNKDLFDVQDQITRRVVNSIAPQIQQAEISRAFQKRPESMTAYDHMLQALHLIYRLEPTAFKQAGSLLKRAIALDDSYAAAYALSAEWHGLRVGQGWSQDLAADANETIRLAEAAIDRDNNNSLALAILGHHRAFLFRDFSSAKALFERALATNPGNARAWGLSAPTYSYIGNHEAAITRAEQALRLSPYDPWAFWYRTSICVAHYTAGQYEQAVEVAHRSLADNPRYIVLWKILAASLAALGRRDEVSAAAAMVLKLEPGFSAGKYALNHPYRDPFRRDRLRQHLLDAGLPE